VANIQDLKPDGYAKLEAAVQAAKAARAADAPEFDYGVPRTPFLITCAMWRFGLSTFPSADPGSRLITLPVNPTKAIFRLGHRMSEGRTRAGRILFVWKNRDRNSFADEPLITFHFSAGNIMSARMADGNIIPARGRVAVWEFMRLLDEEKMVPVRVGGRDVKTASGGKLVPGEPNYVEITYSSMKLPQVTLYGFFTPEGMEFEDDSQNPNAWEWTSAFVVYDSNPRFSNAVEMKENFEKTVAELV